MVDVSRVLKRPVVTEKSTGLAETGRYVFEVDPSATKLQIKLVVKGKRKRFGPRMSVNKNWKKAIVTLAPGESITIFEGV